MIVDCSVCHVLYSTKESFYLSNCAHVLCDLHQHESIKYNYCIKCQQPNIKFMPLKNFKVDAKTHEVDVDSSDSTLNKEHNSISNFFVDITTQLEDFYGVSKFQIMNLKDRCHYLTKKNMELNKTTHQYENIIKELKMRVKDFDELHDRYQLLLQKHYQGEAADKKQNYQGQNLVSSNTANSFLMNVKESVGLLNKTPKPSKNRYPSHNYPSSDTIRYLNREQDPHVPEMMEESSRYDALNQQKKTGRHIKNSNVPLHEDIGSSDRIGKLMRETPHNYSIQPIGSEDGRNELVYMNGIRSIGHQQALNKSSNSRLSSGYYNSKNGSSSKPSLGRGIGGRKGIFSHRKESK